jgi:hypothetical protein
MKSGRVVRLAACACILVIGGCEEEAGDATGDQAKPAGASKQEIPKVDATLELTGSGLGQPTSFSFEQLAAMPFVRLDDVLMLKTHEDDEVTSWQGPALQPLLEAAQIKPGATEITLIAKDGYEMEVTLDDLKDAIIALKNREGQWLSEVERRGHWKLVPPHKPGNFWIVDLERVTVEQGPASAPAE